MTKRFKQIIYYSKNGTASVCLSMPQLLKNYWTDRHDKLQELSFYF